MEPLQHALGKFRWVGEVVGYIVDLIVLSDYFTTRGVLSYLITSIGAQAQTIYNIIVVVVLALAFSVPFYFGYKFHSWQSVKAQGRVAKEFTGQDKEEQPSQPVYSQEQKNYRKKVRYDLFRIRREMSYPWERRAIQFESWNSFVKPDPRPANINNQTQFGVIQNFSTALNNRNDHLIDTTLDDDCIAEYVKIRKTGFLSDDSTEDKPRLTVALTKTNENQVKELEVRFPGRIRRTPAVRFYYITVRNEGKKTADDVRVRCQGNGVRIIPFTSKSSFGIDVERVDEMGTVEYFDKSVPESAISAILNDHNKVKDSIEFIHPGPEGEKFVLFFTVEGYTDKFFIPAQTKLWYNAYGGHLNAHYSPERSSTKVGIHIGARDITGYYAEFEVMLYDWNRFDVKLVGIVEESYDES
ncbi:MAG: hypothetical protein WB643_07035 [Candidatus Bathyarchaeia archaeon]